ncbi:MAG: hypothetical protein ACK5LZ_02090 [Anaerorhabdus sp.]
MKKQVVLKILKKEVAVKGLTSKTDKKYDCKCILEIGDKYINIKPIFEN